ncbi:unnamed protein product [Adineta ricciae]|nr:unnamed protein product [Adineta ricciae]
MARSILAGSSNVGSSHFPTVSCKLRAGNGQELIAIFPVQFRPESGGKEPVGTCWNRRKLCRNREELFYDEVEFGKRFGHFINTVIMKIKNFRKSHPDPTCNEIHSLPSQCESENDDHHRSLSPKRQHLLNDPQFQKILADLKLSPATSDNKP